MSTIHKYENDQHTDTHHTGFSGSYRELSGMGKTPSPAWLAQRGWYYVATKPTAPDADHVWHPSDPAYVLIDGRSTPQGQWVKAPTTYEITKENNQESLAQFRTLFLQTVGQLTNAGYSLPDPLTFRAMAQLLVELGGEWTSAGLALRVAYDDVIFAAGDMKTAYSILPELLADNTLT